MKMVRSMVLVIDDPLSVKSGAEEIYQVFKKEIHSHKLDEDISLSMAVINGIDKVSPAAIIYPQAVIYGPLKPKDVSALVEKHLIKGNMISELIADPSQLSTDIAWLKNRAGTMPAEQRIVLRRVGLIDPESIDDYILHDGYKALRQVLVKMKPEEVISVIKDSGLKGRGGAGFPTGLKWQFVAGTPGKKKYVICNSDESEPGTFKDRTIIEGDPHSIIEAMTIAGYTVGADEGYVYVRGEYKLVQERLQKAITQAEESGFLGNDILGSGYKFQIHIHAGAGAYICGEETALIESIEGRRGEPRPRPPYPTTNGLYGKPTLVNNVETLANIPAILLNGGDWYRSFGTATSPGTKVYTVLGNVNVRGAIEVPLGITLREVISYYAKGMKNSAKLKLAQTGGSSGSIIPASLQDIPIDFASFSKDGVALGSGALLICDENTCVVDLAKVLLNFFRYESCGKCTPCRVGNERAYKLLNNISEGIGIPPNLKMLQQLSTQLYELSHCGLGQTAGAPLRDILKFFRPELEAHINKKICPAGICKMSGQIKST
jgi:NADP-reducing hydrogenase subunit HndC